MLQEGTASSAAVDDIRVSVVMQNDNVIFFCKCDQLIIETVRGNLTDRIQGIGNDHAFGLFRLLLRYVVKVDQEIILLIEGVGFHISPAQEGAGRKDRVARIRHQHDVARIAQGHGYMRDSLLGPVDRHDLLMGQSLNAVAVRIVIADCVEELRQVS